MTTISDGPPGPVARMVRRLLLAMYRGRGWRALGQVPEPRRFILIAAPHTSNWDFVNFLGLTADLGLRAHFMGKLSLFKWPLGGFMKQMGGVPVDRRGDRIVGLAGVDPTKGMDGVRALEDAVKNMGFIGAHAYPHWFELAPDHAKWYPLYAKCVELDIPLMTQAGQSLIYSPDQRLRSVGRPITLDAVACDFPELKLLGIHVGIPWHDEMIAMAWKHENVCIVADAHSPKSVSYTHLRAHETVLDLVCRLLLEKKHNITYIRSSHMPFYFTK